MSRRAQVVRSQDPSPGPARPRSTDGFTWNAMLMSYDDNTVTPGEQIELYSPQPRHTSLGLDVDFDTTSHPVVRIRIPRDGVYSVSARVFTYDLNGTDDIDSFGNAEIVAVAGDGLSFVNIDNDIRPLVESTSNLGATAYLSVSHAGYPFYGGQLVWARFHNFTDHDLGALLGHLSVTYEAALGTIYDKGMG